MDTRKLIIIISLIACNIVAVNAQSIEHALEHYYKKEITTGRDPHPYQYLRESDILWSSLIWRAIDLREKPNQYFYYPTNPEGIDGRINLTYLIWNAAKNSLIPMFEDDELKIPIDNDLYFARYLVGDTIQLEIYDDETSEEFHYETVVVPRSFYSEDVKQYNIKEIWYIDKEKSQQFVRILGLAMIKDKYRTINGEDEYDGSFPLFWIPMQSMLVRRLFATHDAYYEDNVAHLPSWDYIFQSRFYSSYIIRESNRFNRSISDYLTGEEAMLEADKIEDKLLNIEQDMWEY